MTQLGPWSLPGIICRFSSLPQRHEPGRVHRSSAELQSSAKDGDTLCFRLKNSEHECYKLGRPGREAAEHSRFRLGGLRPLSLNPVLASHAGHLPRPWRRGGSLARTGHYDGLRAGPPAIDRLPLPADTREFYYSWERADRHSNSGGHDDEASAAQHRRDVVEAHPDTSRLIRPRSSHSHGVVTRVVAPRERGAEDQRRSARSGDGARC